MAAAPAVARWRADGAASLEAAPEAISGPTRALPEELLRRKAGKALEQLPGRQGALGQLLGVVPEIAHALRRLEGGGGAARPAGGPRVGLPRPQERGPRAAAAALRPGAGAGGGGAGTEAVTVALASDAAEPTPRAASAQVPRAEEAPPAAAKRDAEGGRVAPSGAAEVAGQASGPPACGSRRGGPGTEARETFVGRIVMYSAGRGFGFIDCPEARAKFGCDVFLHRTCLPAEQQTLLKQGGRVTFSVEVGRAGRPKARDLTTCPSPSPAGEEPFTAAVQAEPGQQRPLEEGKAAAEGQEVRGQLQAEQQEGEPTKAQAPERPLERRPGRLPSRRPTRWRPQAAQRSFPGAAASEAAPQAEEAAPQAAEASSSGPATALRPRPEGPSCDNAGRPYDLGRVVVNFVNVGSAYGERVLRRSRGSARLFDYEGVRKCVRHLTQSAGLAVTGVVYENFWAVSAEGTEVWTVPEDIAAMCETIVFTPRLRGQQHRSAHDEMTIKCAYRRNCRFLDNDNYQDWRSSMHDQKIRAWLEHCQDILQMRFYFDTGLGTFDTLDGNIPARRPASVATATAAPSCATACCGGARCGDEVVPGSGVGTPMPRPWAARGKGAASGKGEARPWAPGPGPAAGGPCGSWGEASWGSTGFGGRGAAGRRGCGGRGSVGRGATAGA